MKPPAEKQHAEEVAEISHILKYAGKFKLLSREEEFDLITTFQSAVKVIAFVASLPAPPNRYRRGRKRIMQERAKLICIAYYIKKKVTERIVGANLRLIITYAKSYRDRGLPLTDLISEGVDGLIHAVELFDTSTGNKLSTYSTQWIRQRMGRAIENKSRVVKIPPAVLSKITKLNKIYRKWIEKVGEPPTSEELSEQFWEVYQEKVTSDECEELGRLRYSHSSLDETIGEDENISLVSYLAGDESKQPERVIEKTADEEYVLTKLLEELPREDASFLKLKYGFLDKKERTDKEMSVLLQITVKDVKAKEKELLERLREMGDRQNLNTDFLCDVVLTSTGPNRFATIGAMRIANESLTLYQCAKILDELPARVAYKVVQDKAEELVEMFLQLGARASILNHV